MADKMTADEIARGGLLPWKPPTTLEEAIVGLETCGWWACDRRDDPPIARGWKMCAQENAGFIRDEFDRLTREKQEADSGRDVLFEERRRLRELASFFASCIRSGEAWSPTCDAMYSKAFAPWHEMEADLTAARASSPLEPTT